MKKTQQGFTLIELMIVVAIIGILAAVALPAYQDYVAKSKITSIVATASSGKSAMFDRYSDLGVMPDAAGAAADAIDENGSTTEGFYDTMTNLKYVTNNGVTYARGANDSGTANAKGTFTVTLSGINANVNGQSLEFSYQDDAGELKFGCAVAQGSTIPDKYLPAQCQ